MSRAHRAYPVTWASSLLVAAFLATAESAEIWPINDLCRGNPRGINGAGQVVGIDYRNLKNRGFLWSSGVSIDIGGLDPAPDSFCQALAINDNCQIVGESRNVSGRVRGFLWNAGVMTELGTLSGYEAHAYGINNAGQIVGTDVAASGEQRAVLWQGGTVTDLTPLTGQPQSGAAAMNQAGYIGGWAGTPSGAYAAGIWHNAVYLSLGTLGGTQSIANGINDVGQVVGNSRIASGQWHAFLWTNGAMTDLGVLPGATYSNAYAVNNQGDVVGYSGDRAFLWTKGQMIELSNVLGEYSKWDIREARAVNQAGQIAARGFHPDYGTDYYNNRAVVLTPEPVPVPPTGWTYQHPVPGQTPLTTANLADMWGSGPNDIFAVGAAGTILHFDGVSWSLMTSGTANTLAAVHGSGPNDVYAVGEAGTVLRYNGAGWSALGAGPTGSLTDVWASGPTGVFVANGSSTIWHYSGSTWSTMAGQATISNLWGFGPNDVFAIGQKSGAQEELRWVEADLAHYDGSTWTVAASIRYYYYPGTSSYSLAFNDLWGSSPNNLIAGGKFAQRSPLGWTYNDMIMRYNGTSMAKVDLGGYWGIYGIWGSDANDIYFTRHAGEVLHYDGSSYSELPTGSDEERYGVWGSGPNDVFVAGQSGSIMHSPSQYVLQLSVYDPNLGQVGVDPDVLYHDANSPVVLTAEPEPGKVLQRWIGDVPTGHETDNPLTIRMDSDNQIMALFGPAYTLTLSLPNWEWGMVDVQPVLEYYNEGTNVTLEATPYAYGKFVRWQGDVPGGSSTDNPLTITMDGDKTITAVFESDHALTVTVTEPGWGTVDVDPALPYYADGTPVTLTAVPNDYRNFLRWEGDVPGGSTTENPLTITMDGDKSVTACFEWPMYLLTTSKVNDGQATIYADPISPNYHYPAGTSVVLTAVPSSPGKTFVQWEIDDPNHPGDGNYVTIDTNNPMRIVMDADHHVGAIFHCGSGMALVFPIGLVGLVILMLARGGRRFHKKSD